MTSSKLTVSKNETEEITLGRLVISLDEQYIKISGKTYELTESEFDSIKSIVESKVVTRDDYISKDIKVFEIKVAEVVEKEIIK